MTYIEYNGLVFTIINNICGVGNNTLYYRNAIVGGANYEGDIVIPKYVNGVIVTEIFQWAFRECNKITSIQFNAPIKYIRYAAFYNCNSLRSITIPKTVELIEGYSFSMYPEFTKTYRKYPFWVLFERGTRIAEICGRAFEFQNNTIIIIPVNKLPALGNNLFLSSTGILEICALESSLNFSGILTTKISPVFSKILTCEYKKQEHPRFIIIFILSLLVTI
jgi:hypothetical protein